MGGSDEAEKCKTIVECDEIRAIAEELKDQMEDGEKNEVVIGDDGNWKRAKKRDDEDEEDVEDEAIEEQDGDHEDDTYEHPDADLEPVLELKVSETMLTEQSSCSSPNRLQVAVEEEIEEVAVGVALDVPEDPEDENYETFHIDKVIFNSC